MFMQIDRQTLFWTSSWQMASDCQPNATRVPPKETKEKGPTPHGRASLMVMSPK